MPRRTAVSVPPWARTMPGGARAGALAEACRPRPARRVRARALEEPGAPGPDRAAADHDDVGGRGSDCWSRRRRWHRLNSQSRRSPPGPQRRHDELDVRPVRSTTSTLQAARPHLRRRADPARGRGRDGRRRAAARASSTSTRRARSSSASTPPTSRPSVGGQGCTTLQQVLVQEQAGRVTNALGWVHGHSPGLVASRSPPTDQLERWLLPTVRGEMAECYAITEENAGSDVAAHRGDRAPRRRRLRPRRREVARDVVQRGRLRVLPGAARSTATNAGEHAMFVVDLPSPGVRVVRTPAYSAHHRHHHPIVAFEGVRVPAATWSAARATA